MSNFTSCTMNRGVEANEVEIANARLDLEEESEATQSTGAAAGGARCAGDAPSSPAFTGSYLQVVVEKHKRRREVRGVATSARLPAASSPAAGAGDGAPWPRGAVLLACPAGELAYTCGACGAYGACGEPAKTPSAPPRAPRPWPVFRDRGAPLLACSCPDERAGGETGETGEEGEEGGAEPPCVEVYRFERVGWWLSSGSAPPTRVERRAARAGRAARALAAEVGAAARLAAGAPSAAAALLLRCVLQTARDAAACTLLALSDYGVKPTLTLAFNALLHPPLVFLANVLRGVRAALRPGVSLVGECAAAAAVLLRAVRLVDVHYTHAAPAPAPACACHAHHAA